MAYAQITLSQFILQVSDVLGDTGQVYWVVPEIQSVVYEGLRFFGALTDYWRERGTFQVSPASPSPFISLPVVVSSLRTQTWTLGQMVRDIQYMLLEPANGVAGTGMSVQISISSILNAVQAARDKFVLDVGFPINIHSAFSPALGPDGMTVYPQTSVLIHRVAWRNNYTGVWTNLWREDAWSADRGLPLWTTTPGDPIAFSEAENSPLKLQVVPPPLNAGTIEALTVDSLVIPPTDLSTFGIPDEWIPAIKYGALSRVLSEESQIKNTALADYCLERYRQAVEMTKVARSILRVMVNGNPLPLDTMAALDAGLRNWRNQVGAPQIGAALYDVLCLSPGTPDTTYGIGVDVVRTAPLPALGDYIQIGQELLNPLLKYVCHVLSFKCGGNEFKSTMGDFDSYLKAGLEMNSVMGERVRYLDPLFGQPQRESQQRPDRVGAVNHA